MTNENIYLKYANLTNQIKELEDKKKELNEIIAKELENVEANKMTADFGTFSLVERRTWKYTHEVLAKEQEVKKLKKHEEENDIAVSKISKSLRFQAVK